MFEKLSPGRQEKKKKEKDLITAVPCIWKYVLLLVKDVSIKP